jgi:general secretion pathway protein D
MTADANRLLRWVVRCFCILAAPGVVAGQDPVTQPVTQPASQPQSQPAESIRQVEFQELPLSDAIRLLARQTGLNLVASQEAGKAKVSLYLQNVSPQSVVEELCRANNLWFRQDEASGIVRIMTVSEFQRDLTSFREVQTQVFSVLYPNAVSTASAIADLYGSRVQLSLGEDESQGDSRDISERLNRFDLVDQRSQGIGIFSSGGGTTVGGGGQTGGQTSSSYSGSSGSSYTSSTAARRPQEVQPPGAGPMETLGPLTVTQAQAIAKAMREQPTTMETQHVLDSFRTRSASIYVRVIRRNNLIVVRTSDRAAMLEISKLIRRLDVPTPTVLLEVKVLSIALSDDFSSVFDYQYTNGSGVAGSFAGGDILQPPGDALSNKLRRGASMIPGGTGVRSQDLIFQVVSDNFRFRMQLLEDKNRVTELATPMLLTANNEVSRLFVGEERPIVRNISSNTTLNQTGSVVTPNTTIEFRPVGTTLLITPSINADRTVTFRILQENSRIVTDGATIPVVTSNGGIVNQPVDVVATRTLSGTIVAKDRLMVAVGGLIEDHLEDSRAEVPILGKVPGLGFFFRRQNTGRSRNELIIMIRPHVLNTPAESEAISQGLVKSLSIYPSAGQSDVELKTFKKNEVIRPNLPTSPASAIFRFHSVKPADY